MAISELRASALRDRAQQSAILLIMLMVIFGAGASYDSCPTYSPGMSIEGTVDGGALNSYNRPPLANELFANRPFFAHTITRFPDCQPIVPRLRRLKGETLEAALEDLQTQANDYPRGRRQLAAVRCYLHQVICGSENAWGRVTVGVTNYKSLLDQIERAQPKEPVCLVTFNYDTLLEDALRQFGLPINSFEDYTKSHPFYRVFKLHGSTNWAREIDTDAPIQIEMGFEPESVFALLMENWDSIRVTDRYLFSPHDWIGVNARKLMFPAIAIPVEKKRSFECPAEMLESLVELLPGVSKLLVIGWRATEAHFLGLLGNRLAGLRGGIRLHVVAKGEGDDVRVRICRALANNPPASFSVEPGGFTDFILGGRVADFLGD